MRFYTNSHPYYCGIDLHARMLFVCILDSQGDTLVHQKIAADPSALQALIEPYQNNIVVGVECMHCWATQQALNDIYLANIGFASLKESWIRFQYPR